MTLRPALWRASRSVLAAALFAAPSHAQSERPGEVPTADGFVRVVEAMRAGAYDGLEPPKGLMAPPEGSAPAACPPGGCCRWRASRPTSRPPGTR